MMLDHKVQARTTELRVETTEFRAKTTELRRMLMEMRSYMGGPCTPSYWPHSTYNGQPPPLASPLF